MTDGQTTATLERVLRDNLEGFLFTIVIVENQVESAAKAGDYKAAAFAQHVKDYLFKFIRECKITDEELEAVYEPMRTRHLEQYG